MKNDHDDDNNNNKAERSKDTAVGILDSRFNQTLRNVQGYLSSFVLSTYLVAFNFSS